MLRRQMLRRWRKPLIVMTPKSLLRHKLSVSPIDDLSHGFFALVIPEIRSIDVDKVHRIVFCSGKVYYDLLEAREAQGIDDVPIVRIEQLYPFPIEEYAGQIARYPKAKEIVWCQEEPQNQGAWYQIRHRLQEPLADSQQLYYAGRPGAAAPAAGVFKVHLQQQHALIEAALGTKIEASKSDDPERKRSGRKRKKKKKKKKTGQSAASGSGNGNDSESESNGSQRKST
jgi:2-oxoglutarate dehydrogenase E1 component